MKDIEGSVGPMEWGIFPAAPWPLSGCIRAIAGFYKARNKFLPDTKETEEEYLGVDVTDCKVAWLQYVGYQAL